MALAVVVVQAVFHPSILDLMVSNNFSRSAYDSQESSFRSKKSTVMVLSLAEDREPDVGVAS